MDFGKFDAAVHTPIPHEKTAKHGYFTWLSRPFYGYIRLASISDDAVFTVFMQYFYSHQIS